MKIIRNFVLYLITVTLLSCSSGKKVHLGEDISRHFSPPEIKVEAYLFDVKLRRKGKPTTVRLDLYQTDSVVAMYGRGYFNKGAFSGRITDDSMQIYFPSTNEYLNESIEDLFLSFDCESGFIDINLLGYFVKPPDSTISLDHLDVESIKENDNSKQLDISSKNCPWQLRLGYRKEKKGWRLDMFEFDDGDNVTLKGNRRQYNDDAAVLGDRFLFQFKPDALRIAL